MNLRTTVFAYRSVKYFCRGRYSVCAADAFGGVGAGVSARTGDVSLDPRRVIHCIQVIRCGLYSNPRDVVQFVSLLRHCMRGVLLPPVPDCTAREIAGFVRFGPVGDARDEVISDGVAFEERDPRTSGLVGELSPRWVCLTLGACPRGTGTLDRTCTASSRARTRRRPPVSHTVDTRHRSEGPADEATPRQRSLATAWREALFESGHPDRCAVQHSVCWPGPLR